MWNDRKITAHHAIIPSTNGNVNYQRFSEAEGKLYDLICRYYVAQFLGHFIYVNRTATILSCDEFFKATCNTPVKPGWRQALNEAVTDLEEGIDPSGHQAIPLLKEGETVLATHSNTETRKTLPPLSYTEGTLIETMKTIGKQVTDPELKKVLKESAGIGTEATRANILETLIKRGYLIREGKALAATPRGQAFIDLLPGIIADPATTARWEQELDAIAQGGQTLDGFLSRQASNLNAMLDALAAKRNQPALPRLPPQPTKAPAASKQRKRQRLASHPNNKPA
jgi:DNA topoisomerase-3